MPSPHPVHQRLLDILGDRDPMQVLFESIFVLTDMGREYSKGQLSTRPFEGKWTPLEIIGHLVDHESVATVRLRTILCESEPAIPAYDQEAWATRQHHNNRAPRYLLNKFSRLRKDNWLFWKNVREADWDRVGIHSERGPESLALMLTLHAGHDLVHLEQIRRYLDAISESVTQD